MRQRGGAKTSRAPMSGRTEAHEAARVPPAGVAYIRLPAVRSCMPILAIRSVSTAWTNVKASSCCDFLFDHQLRPQFQYAHRWAEGDVLVLGQSATLHSAEADYRADEPRLIKRCQAMADRVFTPDFRRLAQTHGESPRESTTGA